MQVKFLKFFLFVISIILFLIISMGGAIYIEYNKIAHINPPSRVISTKIIPDNKVKLGDIITVKYYIAIPWNKRPIRLKLNLNNGIQQIGNNIIKIHSYRWGYFVWEVSFAVQPFIVGKILKSNGVLLVYNLTTDRYSHLSLYIPEIVSKELLLKDNSIKIAGEIKPSTSLFSNNSLKKNLPFIIGLIIFIILIAIIIAIFFIKRKVDKRVELNPWSIAIMELLEIKGNLETVEDIEEEKIVSKLTDIIKVYLQKRFKIKATKQTTEEFLIELERRVDSPLSNRNRNFLKDFLKEADMVKFAKYKSSKEQLLKVVDRAISLVKDTIPNLENNDSNIKSN